jgi:hypothetical protein
MSYIGFRCQQRRWPEKYYRFRRAVSLIEKVSVSNIFFS